MKKTALVILTFTLLAGCGKHEPQSTTETPEIKGSRIVFPRKSPQIAELRLALAKPAESDERSVPGRLEWNEDATVRIFAPMAGRVSQISAQLGDKVTVGQGLATVLSPDMGSAQADARKAQAVYEQVKSQYDRAHDLADHGVVAAKDVEQAKADLATAEAERDRTLRQLGVLGGTAKVIDEGYQLRSPIAGTVVDRHINPGQQVKPDADQPEFVVTDPDHLWLDLDVPELDLRHFKVGEAVQFTVSAWPDEMFSANVKSISAMVDPQKRTVTVRADVNNSSHRLKGEMFAEARVTEAAPKGIDVPDTAVFLLGQKQYVFVFLPPNAFERREVKAEIRPGGHSIITDGITAGDKVVSAGALLLQQMLEAK